MEPNTVSLDTVCASLCYAMGIASPTQSADKNTLLSDYVDQMLGSERADRVFMYNPDAIAEWIYKKYNHLFSNVLAHTELEIPLCSVMPSVTPVCFGTMYTGAQPSVHGIMRYEKPVISIDTIFDALIRAGKKPVIISYGDSSLSKIYLERDMDYYILDTVEEVNAKAKELILRDEHDLYVVYNGNYDSVMHKTGPESKEAIAELGSNCSAFENFAELIRERWTQHNTLLGFAMDHGCHEIDGDCGSHGLDMPEDLNIVHLYKCIKKA